MAQQVVGTSARRWSRRTRRPSGWPGDQTASSAVELVDLHGHVLYVLASLLTGNPAWAERIVVQVIRAHRGAPTTRHDLVSAVRVAWQSRPPSGPAPTVAGLSRAEILHELHLLPDDQRIALALCRFGGQTYREAAETLGVGPAHVARLLRDAMRGVTLPPDLPGRAQPAA